MSLLKPLKGVDPNLINNLETFFELDYPKVSTLLSSLEMDWTMLFPRPMVNTYRGILTDGIKKSGCQPHKIYAVIAVVPGTQTVLSAWWFE